MPFPSYFVLLLKLEIPSKFLIFALEEPLPSAIVEDLNSLISLSFLTSYPNLFFWNLKTSFNPMLLHQIILQWTCSIIRFLFYHITPSDKIYSYFII